MWASNGSECEECGLWVMTPCSPVGRYKRYGNTCYLHLPRLNMKTVYTLLLPYPPTTLPSYYPTLLLPYPPTTLPETRQQTAFLTFHITQRSCISTKKKFQKTERCGQLHYCIDILVAEWNCNCRGKLLHFSCRSTFKITFINVGKNLYLFI